MQQSLTSLHLICYPQVLILLLPKYNVRWSSAYVKKNSAAAWDNYFSYLNYLMVLFKMIQHYMYNNNNNNYYNNNIIII